MNLIVAVDENWGIGYKGELLERISEDMKYFKEKTMGKTVVMGRVTFESLPGKKALPGRKNIVLSSAKDLPYENIVVYDNYEELLDNIKNDSEVFVIGGAKVYKLLLPFCNKAFVTKIYGKYESDAEFSNLDTDSCWELSDESDIFETSSGVKYRFTVYTRKS